ncbi:MAG: hypothetical protein KatS3mg130_0769 [Candidatus Sumerlaea sp.]|jgi:transcriptional regulator with GAF, ATPase, and Fis domain|uniref:Sigma-54 dependent response regulator n=1 Tax=Sumerlaea chitinivorans TaxID=2250252 RepID=A0A2Z4Y2A5_SUMC1|nr:Sigma-54 dependent response regulator [Candidatus Sumerlaea chitinivorans]GIX44361.1 MAG: hypothetical protein KatS3mg130_0769 [Candidatus Sumerlaea sp.]
MAKFVVKEGPASGQEIPFPGEHFTIGRSEECEVIIADPNVSRQHAQVIARDGSAMLVDLNSSNGTFVNGNPISKVFLMDGDEIRVGETVLIYVETSIRDAVLPSGMSQRVACAPSPAKSNEGLQRSSDPLNQTRLFTVPPETLPPDALKETYLKLKTLYRIFCDLSLSTSIKEIAEIVLRAGIVSTGVERVALFVRKEDDGEWECLHQKVASRLIGREGKLPMPPAPALDGAAEAGAIVLGFLAKNGEWRTETTSPNAAIFPVCASERDAAMLYVDNPDTEVSVHKDDLDFLATLAQQMGVRLLQIQLLQQVREENVVLRRRLEQDATIVTQNPHMRRILEDTQRIAATEATVLITGETGTGKELIARTLHEFSPRRTKPFIAVNCAALPETLLESELFGHEKGAFTGALEKRIGKFELAHGGTLFLDEIGDLSQSAQAKLLRVLQEGEIQRVGGQKIIKVDVRVIAATNKDLAEEVRKGNFRQDLYYRIRVIEISLPPLRERKDDIPVLAQYFLQQLRRKFPTPVKQIAPETIQCLVAYEFPGNVRELKNIIERGLALARGETLKPEDLPAEVLLAAGCVKPRAASSTSLEEGPLPLAEVERQHIRRVLKFVHGNKLKAAALLGISRTTLYEKLKELGELEDSDAE